MPITAVRPGARPGASRPVYAVQQPLAGSTFNDVVGVLAWQSLPTWYLVAQNDQAIPSDTERFLAQRMSSTRVEIPSNHLAMVSHPGETPPLIGVAAGVLIQD